MEISKNINRDNVNLTWTEIYSVCTQLIEGPSLHSEKKHSKRKTMKKAFKKRTAYVAAAVAFFIVLLLAFTVLRQTSTDTTPKAVLVDQLSIHWSNMNFTETARNLLGEVSLPVDYYSGEEVTVNFYRQLARHNYKIIIFRVHSTGECDVTGQPPFVVFFSCEQYISTNHVSDQIAMRLVKVFSLDGTTFFGISPLFIKDAVDGRFNDTIIIAMGCDSLMHTTMAEAFIEKGAKAYIGWTEAVTIGHTDDAIIHLLGYLVNEKQTIQEAVKNTMKQVGPDPVNQSRLEFYPKEAANYTIPNYVNNTAFHNGETSINAVSLVRIKIMYACKNRFCNAKNAFENSCFVATLYIGIDRTILKYN